MKLNHKQSLHIIGFLYSNKFLNEYSLSAALGTIGELFDDEIKEARVITRYGMAGKLWNDYNQIFISGYNESEMKSFTTDNKHRIRVEIEMANRNIAAIIELYK